jgi:hypothetical protein
MKSRVLQNWGIFFCVCPVECNQSFHQNPVGRGNVAKAGILRHRGNQILNCGILCLGKNDLNVPKGFQLIPPVRICFVSSILFLLIFYFLFSNKKIDHCDSWNLILDGYHQQAEIPVLDSQSSFINQFPSQKWFPS